jgi:hypothetical protein
MNTYEYDIEHNNPVPPEAVGFAPPTEFSRLLQPNRRYFPHLEKQPMEMRQKYMLILISVSTMKNAIITFHTQWNTV